MKPKYQVKKQIEVVGIVDETPDGRIIFCVEEEEYDAIEILRQMIGSVIQLKSTDEIEV